jgi:hypothetical protein
VQRLSQNEQRQSSDESLSRRWPPRRVEQAHRIAGFVGVRCSVLRLDPETIRDLRTRGITDPLTASDDAHLLGLAEQRICGDGTVTLHPRWEDS